ncbi:MAG: ferritin-like domain-containing protein [Anaerolineae bacterium]
MPQVSRREFLKLAALAAGGLMLPPGLAGAAGALGSGTPPPSTCIETAQGVLDVAATLESLAMTFYYQATQAAFFTRLPTYQRAYVQAALDQEWSHYKYLLQQGATPQATAFYFPPGIFDFSGFARFIAAIETLETGFMDAYLAAARRFTELGQPVMAEIANQIVGIEAEHRVLGRELSGESPPPPNNVCFERAAIDCPSQIIGKLGIYIHGGLNYAGPVAMPTGDQMTAVIGRYTCQAVTPATPTTCDEDLLRIFNIAATAEALGITFYYAGIQGGFFHALPATRQWYLQAALDEERHHLDFLKSHGASPAATTFYFPQNAFDDLPTFLQILDTLENVFIGAYLAATQRLAQLGQPLLAQTVGQILGVEAEHRILGRIIAEKDPPNDLCLEVARYTCLADAEAAIAPFVQPSGASPRQVAMPTPAQITTAVDAFGCAAVPMAAYRVYFPMLREAAPVGP